MANHTPKHLIASDIIKLIKSDRQMMKILKIARGMNLPDWWIGAGFIRSKVWDVLHDFANPTPLNDVDVIFFDKEDIKEAQEKMVEQTLRTIAPEVPWSVTNQARMHIVNHDKPYTCSRDAISKWPETATCIAAQLNNNDQVELAAPHGVDDLIHLIVRPTATFIRKPEVYENRIEKKCWQSIWPKLRIIHLK